MGEGRARGGREGWVRVGARGRGRGRARPERWLGGWGMMSVDGAGFGGSFGRR